MNRLGQVRPTAVWVAVAVSAFHLAYGLPSLSFLVVIYLLALIQLAGSGTWRVAFYSGLAVGLGIAAVQLGFFWTVFGAGAVALWLVFAFWVGFFVALARAALLRFGRLWGSLAVPVVWCGVEYFRSELYYLRFSWLSPGLAFGPMVGAVPAAAIGGYGIGLILAAIAAASVALWRECGVRGMSILVLGTAGFFVLGQLPREKVLSPKAAVAVAGVQMEFPTEQEVLLRLNEVIHAHPEAELLVLSEYTFTTPVPDKVKTWCRNHHRYLIVGGERPAGGNQFYNTAFVVSPEGDIVFNQEKSVPIQFFRDGLPARQNTPWNSPWGKIGICICYDLSYSRVTDRLVRAGAEALIVPTMDVADWGIRQHRLHARVAPLRAAEYTIPIFRVASSGISQLVDSSGRVTAEAPCPGEGSIIAGRLELKPPGGLPLDRWLAPGATVMTGVLSALLFIQSRPRSRGKPSGGVAQMERIPVASA